MLLKYNALASVGAALGFVNSLLTWKLLGTSAMADAWLLAWTICLSLSILILAGVEQFLVFYSEKLIQSSDAAEKFLFLSLVWAVLTGVVFACVFIYIAPILVRLFASGFSDPQKTATVSLLVWLLPQVAIAPLLHVVKLALNAHGKYGISYILSLIIPFVMMVALLGLLWVDQKNTHILAQVVFAASVLQAWVGLWLIRNMYKYTNDHDFVFFKTFVKNSVTMRLGHSLHNFFVNLIMNNVVSMQGVGSFSIFQYAKRFADGVASVTIGPQSGIYHARQARAWSERNMTDFLVNIRVYLKNCLSLLVVMGGVVWWLMPYVFEVFSRNGVNSSLSVITSVYFFIVVWHGIIAVESVGSGVVIVAKKSTILWFVNLVFILAFYAYTRSISSASALWAIPVMAILAQIGSVILHSIFAWGLVKKQF